jgi:hypothetical protein
LRFTKELNALSSGNPSQPQVHKNSTVAALNASRAVESIKLLAEDTLKDRPSAVSALLQ